MYPSMQRSKRSFKNSKTDLSTNGHLDVIETKPDASLLGIQSINELGPNSRITLNKGTIKTCISDFISHERSHSTNKVGKVNMKSYYVGRYKNPEISNTIQINYEDLNLNEFSNTKFGCMHKLSQNSSKWNTLYDGFGTSGV